MSQQNLSGKRFIQYDLQEEIGRSRNSVVYRALQPSVNRQVAIKLLSGDLAQDPTFVDRFHKEMQRLAGLEHFNIQPVYGVGVEQGVPYIVTRYLSGGSLATILMRQKVLSPDVTVALADQVAAGLDYAHAQGISHRDLKPSNILFDHQGNAYVSDFGLSWLLAAGNPTTATGNIGEPAYMSPEIASGMRDVGPSTDIYSMGVMLFESLTGQPPFTGTNALALVRRHLTEQPPTLTSINPSLPVDVDAVIMTALAKRPEDRYATAGDLADALAEACGTEAGLTTVVGLDGFLSVAETDTTPMSGEEAAEVRGEQPAAARRANEWMIFTALATLLGLGIVLVGGYLLLQMFGGGTPTPTPGSAEVTPTEPPTEIVTQGANPVPTVSPTPQPTGRPVSSAPGGGSGRIAYISERSGNPELYILDLVTNDLIQVTRNTGTTSQPVWSPNGQWLAYVSDLGRDTPQIFVVGPDGQNPRDITTRDRVLGFPLWLPDSETIAYYILEGEERVLRKVNINEAQPLELTRLPASFMSLLDWTPDNHVIYYGYARSGALAVVSADPASGNREPITVSGNIPFMSFSPDRSRAAFTLMAGSQSQLFLADTSCPLIDQCNALRLVTDEFSYFTPRFSPDGKSLLVTSDRGGNLDLWTVSLDGTVGDRLPGSGLDDYEGAWQP